MSEAGVSRVVLQAQGLSKRFAEGGLDVDVLRGIDLSIAALCSLTTVLFAMWLPDLGALTTLVVIAAAAGVAAAIAPPPKVSCDCRFVGRDREEVPRAVVGDLGDAFLADQGVDAGQDQEQDNRRDGGESGADEGDGVGEAAVADVELHRGDTEVEDDAVDRVIAAAARDRFQIREFVLHQDEPVVKITVTRKEFDAKRGFRRYFWKATPVRDAA